MSSQYPNDVRGTDFYCKNSVSDYRFLRPSFFLLLLRNKRFCYKKKKGCWFRARITLQQHFCSRELHFEIFVNLLSNFGKLEPSPLFHFFTILMALILLLSVKSKRWCRSLWVRNCNCGASHHTTSF